MSDYWNGKLALITGASSGIGAAAAEKLASKGLKIILAARNSEKLQKVAEKIRSHGGEAYCFSCDLSKSENRISLIKTIKSEIGIPDILINSAGVGWYGYFSQMPWKIANELLSLNIEATTHLTSLLLPDMLTLKRVRIINIGSIAGKLLEQGIAIYSASKAYLDAFSKSLYRELRGTGITVSILRAGAVKTNFFDNAADYKNGGRIPGEALAIPPARVANKVWSLVQFPRRYAYVPFYVSFSPLLETLFSWSIDLAGPILLRHSQKS